MSKCESVNPLENIKTLYTELANNPERDFGWNKGKENALALNYKIDWLEKLPSAVWESCAAVGNPFSISEISSGQTVVDLGCGAGADVCVAAMLVGGEGRVIGFDCTPAMVNKTLTNAQICGFNHVEAHEADITKIPLADNSVDIVISNGAINLSASKTDVLKEALRILKPNGRLQIADMIREGENGEPVEENHTESWADCVLGTLEAKCFIELIRGAGFQQVSLVSKTHYKTADNTIGALFFAVK